MLTASTPSCMFCLQWPLLVAWTGDGYGVMLIISRYRPFNGVHCRSVVAITDKRSNRLHTPMMESSSAVLLLRFVEDFDLANVGGGNGSLSLLYAFWQKWDL